MKRDERMLQRAERECDMLYVYERWLWIYLFLWVSNGELKA